MPKKQGDLKKDNSFSDIGNMFNNIADNIAVEGERTKCFLNFKPIPITIGEKSFTEVNGDGFWRSKRKIKSLVGGNRSGKSFSCCIEAIIVFTGMIPYALRGIYAWEDVIAKLKSGDTKRPRRVRINVMDYTNHFPTVVRPMLIGNPSLGEIGYLPEGWDNYDPDEHIFYGPDGSFLHIYSADPNESDASRKARGGQFDHIWTDEPNSESIHSESVSRTLALKDGTGTITHSFCPEDGYEAWHYEGIYKTNYNPVTYRPKPINEQNQSIYVQVITPMDNPYASKEAIETMKRSCRPWEIDSKLLGRYSHRGDDPCFNMPTLEKWEKQFKDKCVFVKISPDDIDSEIGEFKGNIEVVEHNEALSMINSNTPIWRLWSYPQNEHKYIMTADNSLGYKHSDYNVCDIFDVTNNDAPFQVAQLRIREIRGSDFAIQCAMMANFFGDCLIAPEMNCGEVFIDTLRMYPNFYTRRQASEKLEEKELEKYGFSTNKYSKANIIENMHTMIMQFDKDEYCPFNSYQTLIELQSYQEKIIKTENHNRKTWGAKSGMNDDCAMTAMIAFWIAKKEYEKITICKLKESISQSMAVNQHRRIDDKIDSEKKSFNNLLIHRKNNLYTLSQQKARESCHPMKRK